ncbi:MAG: hypothetical protein RL734_1867 [Bacteroidota bacterium]
MASITLKSSLIKGLMAGFAAAIMNSALYYAFKNLGAFLHYFFRDSKYCLFRNCILHP